MKKIYCLLTIPILTPRQQLQVKALQDEGFDLHALCWDRFGMFQKEEFKDGLQFTMIQPNEKGKEIQLAEKQSSSTLWGDNTKSSTTMVSLLRLWVKTLKRLMFARLQIVVCYHWVFLPLAVLTAKFRKVKVVYDISEFTIDHALNWVPLAFHFIGAFLKFSETTLVKAVDGVTCVPDRKKSIYRTHVKACKNIQVIMNVPGLKRNIDLGLYNELSKRYNSQKIVVYAGAIRLAKKIMEAVKATEIVKRNHPEIKLLFIGGSFGDDSDFISRYVTNAGLGNNVEIIPFKPYNELETYYSIGCIGLNLPSHGGGYRDNLTIGNSRKNFDYMKAGLPLIVPDFGGMGDLVREADCGFIVTPKFSAEYLAVAIRYFLDNPLKAKKMGKNGRRAFLHKYNWEIEKKKFLKVYHGL